MPTPYIGEIRMFAGSFAPVGWLFCNGQTVSISEYETLYSIINTTYGGNGQDSFALPDLRGRLPIHAGTGPSGNGYVIGQSLGTEEVTLLSSHLPAHRHTLVASSQPGSAQSPAGNFFAASAAQNSGYATTADSSLSPSAVATSGAESHNNMQPYLCVNFIIATDGAYPAMS